MKKQVVSAERFLVVCAALLVFAWNTTGWSAPYYWTGNSPAGTSWTSSAGGSNWSLNANNVSDPGTPPPAGSDIYFVFAGALGNTYSSTTLGANFSVNSLNFNGNANSPVGILGSNTLTIGAGGITALATAASQNIGANVAVGAAQTWTDNASTSTESIGGVFHAGDVVSTVVNGVTVSYTVQSTDTNLSGVAIGVANAINANASLSGLINATTNGGIVNVAGYQGVPTLSSSISGAGATTTATTFNGAALTISGGISGSAAITLQGNGSTQTPSGAFIFSGSNSYSGAITLLNANTSLTLGGSGTLANAAGLTLGGGSVFTVDDTGTNVANRLASTLAVNSNGGQINLLGNSSAASADQIGPLNLNTGTTLVNATPGAGQSATLTIASLKRLAGASVNFSSSGTFALTSSTPANGILGSWATIGPLNNSAAVNFAAVSGVNVVPYTGYDTNVSHLTTTGTAFATSNMQLNSTAGVAVLGGNVTINTLYLTGSSGVQINTAGTNTTTLTIGAGGIIASLSSGSYGIGSNQALITNGAWIGGPGFSNQATDNQAGSIAVPAGVPDLVVTVPGTYNPVSGLINGALQLNVKNIVNTTTALGTATASTSAGSTLVTLTAGNTSGLYPGAAVTGLGGTGISGTTQYIVSIVDATHFTIGNAPTSSGAAATATFTGNTGLTKNGGGLLDIADGNQTNKTVTYSFAGPTTVNGGVLLIAADGNFGAAPSTFNPAAIVLNGGEIRSTAGVTLNANRGVTVGPQGGVISYTGGSTFTLSQKITGAGGMTFDADSYNGAVTFNLSNAVSDTYQGPTTVQIKNGSTLAINNSNALPAGTALTLALAPNFQSGTGSAATPVTGFGTFNLSAASLTIGSLSSPAGLTNANLTCTTSGAVLTIGGSATSPVTQNATFNGLLTSSGTGALGLVKNGGGIETFTNANTYTRGTTINGGAINVSNTAGSALGSGTVAVNNGGSLGGFGIVTGLVTVNNGGQILPTLVGGGATTLQLNGGLTLNSGAILGFNLGAINSGTNPIAAPTSDNIYSTGALSLSAGTDTINISSVGSGLAIGTYHLITAGSVPANLNGVSFTVNGPLKDLYSVVDNTANKSLDLVVTSNPNPFLTWVGAPGSGQWDLNAANKPWSLSPGAAAFTNGANLTFDNTPGTNATITVAANVAPSSLTFNNNIAVSYTFSGTGSITGATGLMMNNVGTVTFSNTNTFTGPAAIQSGTIIVGAAGSLANSAFNVSSLGTLAVNGALTGDPAISDSGTITFNNASQAVSSLSGPGLVTLNGTTLIPAALALSGTLNGTGGVTVNVSGSTIQLSPQASLLYSGPTNVLAGTLQLAGANNLANSITAINAANGLAFSGGVGGFTLAGLSGSGGFALTDTAGGAVTLTVGGSGVSTQYSGNLTGNGGLTLAGGTLNLSGSNSNTGTTSIVAGALLQLANSSALQNSTAAVNSSNGLAFSPGIGGFVLGGLSGSGGFALDDGANVGVALTVGGNGASTQFGGGLSGLGSLTKTGSGKLLLAGSNSYSGATTVSAGVLQFATPSSLYAGNSSSWTPANISVASSATLALNIGGSSDFTAAQASSVLSNLSTVNNNGLQAGATFGLDTTNATAAVTYGGRIADTTGTGGGALGFYKTGPGTLILSASANAYSGATTVNNGTLILNGANSGTGAMSATNTTVGGLTVLAIRNAGALGSGTANSQLAPISMNATGTNLSASILEIGAKIGTDPGGNNADFSYQVIQPEANQTPTNTPVGNGQISLGILGNNDDGTGFAAYNANSLAAPRVVALYSPTASTSLATLTLKYQFGLGNGDHITLGSPTANNTLILLNPIDLNGGPHRRFASIRGVGNTPEGEFSGAIINSVAGQQNNVSFDGNGGLIFSSLATSYTASTLQINGGAIFVAASDPAAFLQNGALGSGTATIQCGTSATINPDGGTPVATSPGAHLAFMTYGPNGGISGVAAPTVVTNRNISVGGADVTYASMVLGGATNDYTAMNGNISLNEPVATPTTFTARNGGRVDFGGVISGNGSVLINNSIVEGDATTPGIALNNNGIIVFNGANTYTGTTTITAGKLYINGGNLSTTTNTSSIAVGTGTTLGGMGTINGPVTVAGGGILEAGQAGVGALTLNSSLTFTGSASIAFGGLSPVGNPGLFIAGGLNTNGNPVTLSFTSTMSVGDFALVNYPGVATNTFVLPASLPNRAAGTLVVNGSELDLDVTSLSSIVWTGSANSKWDTTSTNWVVQGGGSTQYIDNPGDSVIFDDTAAPRTSLSINGADVHPNSVTFNNNTSTYTISGTNAIAGATGLNLAGTGTVVLLNVNTFTGPTSIAGTLQLGNGQPGSDGSISQTSAIANNGALIFDLTGSQSYNAVISGSGSLTLQGGLVALTSSNTYSGGTTISGGTLQLGVGATGHDGAVSGNITNNGALAFNYAGTSTIPGLISGSGAVIKSGQGTVVITNAGNSYSSGLFLNGGVFELNLSNASNEYDLSNSVALNGGAYYAVNGVQHVATGNGATINVGVQGGALAADGGFDLYASGVLTGSGALSLINYAGTGSSAIHISNSANSYSGTVTVDGNTGVQVSIDDNNALAAATLNLNGTPTSGSTVVFGPGVTTPTLGALLGNGNIDVFFGTTVAVGNNNASTVYSGRIFDSGALTKIGSGLLTLTGSNTFSGMMTVSSGTLQIGNGGTTGSLAGGGSITNNATLVFNRSNAITQGTDFSSAAISGTGALVQAGSGTLVLTAANTYSGPTNVLAGTLAIDASGLNQGALPNSSVIISASGTLLARGNAGIGGSVSSSGAISLVDNLANTLSVSGGINLNSSSLSFELGNSGAIGTADQIAVGGAATLSGTNTINLVVPPGQSLVPGATAYTLLSAASGLNTGGSFVLGTSPAGFDQFVLHNSSTAETVTITGNANPATAYWTGAASRNAGSPDNANLWGYGAHLSPMQSNWSTAANGMTDAVQVPGLITNVIFTAASATGNSGVLTTTLDSGYSINSLTFGIPASTGITSTVIDTHGNLLTIGTGGLTVASATDPAYPNASAVTIGGSGSVGLLASQTWANNNATQTLTVSSSITGLSGSPTLTIGGSGAGGVVLSGVISDGASSGLSLVINQAGVTTLTNSNAYTGGTTVNGGILSISNGINLGTAPATLNPTSIVLNGGAIQFTAGTGYQVQTLNPNRGMTLGASSGTINVNFPATGVFDTSENSVVYTAPIVGGGNLTVTGGSSPNTGVSGQTYLIELGGNNTYTGSTTINNAVVAFYNSKVLFNNVLPTTTVLNLVNNAWFVLNNEAAQQTVVGLNGDPTTIVGTTNSANPVVVTITPSAGLTANFAGAIEQVDLLGKTGANSTISLVLDGPGTQILSGSNAYTGTTTISQGTLQIGNGGTTGSLSGGTGGSVITVNDTLVFDRSNTVTQGTDFSSAAITGNGVLVQAGSGTLVLTGTNTYSGGTIVENGILTTQSPTALPSGTNLTVGQGASSLFSPALATPQVTHSDVVAVPEPGTAALLAAGVVMVMCFRRRRSGKVTNCSVRE
jgi:fibronectin-binding autotransporter adhesin